MPPITRLPGRVGKVFFCATLLAANTAFSIDHKPAQVLDRDFSIYFIKTLCKNVFLEGEGAIGTTKQNVDAQGVILKGYDVVAFFKERKAIKGSSEWSATYQNAAYLFSSAANKAEFEKDPARYVPQYGGFCAYGVTLDVLADPEVPDAFLVYKGKLYVCGNQGALKDFKKDIDSNVEKANANWRQLATQ
jgi:YHS domain-containing protein